MPASHTGLPGLRPATSARYVIALAFLRNKCTPQLCCRMSALRSTRATNTKMPTFNSAIVTCFFSGMVPPYSTPPHDRLGEKFADIAVRAGFQLFKSALEVYFALVEHDTIDIEQAEVFTRALDFNSPVGLNCD